VFRVARIRGSHLRIVQGTRATYEVTVGEVEALRAYVAELAGPHDADAAERLLGQLAALAQHQDGNSRGDVLRFTPVPAARGLAARAMDALRSEGDVRMGGRRWRLHRPRPSKASKMRLAPGRSPGEGAS
jgi:CRP-like cAMP-binding protein